MVTIELYALLKMYIWYDQSEVSLWLYCTGGNEIIGTLFVIKFHVMSCSLLTYLTMYNNVIREIG